LQAPSAGSSATGAFTYLIPPLPDLKVKRHPFFCQERLENRAQEIGWILTRTDVNIMSNFDRDRTDEIENKSIAPPGTVPHGTSLRVSFSFSNCCRDVRKFQ